MAFVYRRVSWCNAVPAENCPSGSGPNGMLPPVPCRAPIGNQLRAAFVGNLPGWRSV